MNPLLVAVLTIGTWVLAGWLAVVVSRRRTPRAAPAPSPEPATAPREPEPMQAPHWAS